MTMTALTKCNVQIVKIPLSYERLNARNTHSASYHIILGAVWFLDLWKKKVECSGSGQLRYILFLQVRWQPLPVNAGPSPLGLDGQLQGVGQLFLPLLVRLPLPCCVSSSVDRQNRLSLLFQHLAVVSVAVVVELEPSGKYWRNRSYLQGSADRQRKIRD